MMRNADSDLNMLLGEPKKTIRSMFVPFLIAAAVVEINQFVDTFWVSGLGTASSSAVATITPVYGLMMCAALGIGTGATVTIAFRLGNNEPETANRLAANAMNLGIICAVISSALVFVFIDPAISMMGADDIREESKAYMLPFIAMSPALLLSSILGGILRAEGAASKSTAVQMSAAVLNMVIDPIFIYGAGLGVLGAGLSTTVSAMLALLIGLRWFVRGDTMVRLRKSDLLKADGPMMREVLGVGGPKTIQSLISNFTDVLQRVFIIIAGGTAAVMLYNYPWKYIGIVNLPARSMENSMIPVCSATYGQKDLKKMRTGFIYTLQVSVAVSTLLAIALFIFAEPLMAVLTYEESMAAMRPEFVWCLRVSAFLIPFSALMGISSSILQSLKKAKTPMYFMLIWGFLKIGMYAVACNYSFEAIIYCMVAVHWFGGICLIALAMREYRKVAKMSSIN